MGAAIAPMMPVAMVLPVRSRYMRAAPAVWRLKNSSEKSEMSSVPMMLTKIMMKNSALATPETMLPMSSRSIFASTPRPPASPCVYMTSPICALSGMFGLEGAVTYSVPVILALGPISTLLPPARTSPLTVPSMRTLLP